jgi:hypothetical protein
MLSSFQPSFRWSWAILFLLPCAAPAQTVDPQVLPPRAAASDYLSNGSAGAISIGAEFKGHVVPTPEGNLTSEEYVVVEVGVFGPEGKPLKLAASDFTLRINGKTPLPAQPYGLIAKDLKDPEMEPLSKDKDKPKTSMTGGGGGQAAGEPPPAPVKVPVETRRAWTQRLQKASLPEGDRALPVAGFLYFPHRGKSEGMKSLELIYNGPAGKASLTLEP